MINRLTNYMRRSFAIGALIACLCATTAFAQLDPGSFPIYQNGAQVGVIYVPDRAANTSLYAEHWILFPNYVYPSATNGVRTEILPAEQRYTSEADFFRSAPWGPGFRYVHVASTDTTILPGR